VYYEFGKEVNKTVRGGRLLTVFLPQHIREEDKDGTKTDYKDGL
jgi:hypothetical protein